MKLDIVRAWKDETYRQSLSDEQRDLLPVNPAGELTDAEMEQIYGGGGGGLPPSPVAPAAVHHYQHVQHYHHGGSAVGVTGSSHATAASFLQDIHWHSVSAALCDTSVFSAVQTITPTAPLLSPITVICANAG